MNTYMYGAFTTLVVSIFVIAQSTEVKQFSEIKALKEKCEQTLPRNEHCVIIAVPISKD